MGTGWPTGGEDDNLLLMRLQGRTVLITGASSGIGRATAIAMARAGARIKATGRDRHALQLLAEESGAEHLSADLGERTVLDEVARWAGDVDVLVNNAGYGWVGPFQGMDPEEIDALVRVNLLASLVLTNLLLPGMLERGAGHVVNVASIAGHVGVPHEAAYAATKAGLIAFTESLRYELSGSGVGVTLVSPGVVDTNFFEREGRPYGRSFPRKHRPEAVAGGIVRAIERGRADVFVPRWMSFPARLRGAMPGVYRRLASRFG
jgi:short-subunit dehydrogenase